MPVETSIVIRTLNEAKHLELLLSGVHEQNYQDWEIVLVDSGSTDGTLEIAERYGAKIHHIPQAQFTFGRSLNLGCQKSQGKYLVFVSGHVWPITNNWLGNLVKPFQEPSIAMVYGRQRGTSASSLPELRDLQAEYGTVSHIAIDDPAGNNGNAAIRRELWVDEPFDESLPGMEDVDWANKMERIDYRVYYAADAAVYHVHEETLKQIHRRYLREAIAYKRMFPNFWLSASDAFRGFALSGVRDLLYAFRRGKRSKIFQVPGFRAAQYLGFYQGVRNYRRLTRQTVQGIKIPETYHRVEIAGPGVHELKEAQVPRLKPDEVLIQVAYAGVSTRDIAIADGKWRDGLGGHPSYPVVPGVEYSGIVVKDGGNTGSIRRGQKVAGRRFFRCGVCAPCVAANSEDCLQLAESTADPLGGGYSHYCVVPSRFIHKMPLDMSLKQGALLAPLAGCLEALDRMAPKPGRRACVMGAGMTGNLCVQILAARGLRITVVDPQAKWLPFLAKYDVDTLTDLDSLDKYDYLIATGGEDLLNGSVKSAESATKILVIGASLAKWLPFLAKYDVDTLTDLDSLDKYDYLIATGGEDLLNGSVKSAESATKILVTPHCPSTVNHGSRRGRSRVKRYSAAVP